MIRRVKTGWEADFWPDGRYGSRVRRIFRTQAEARRFESVTRSKSAMGEKYSAPRVDRRRLLELVHVWYELHGITLKDGKSRLTKLRQLANLLGNPYAASIRAADVARFRQSRIDQGLTVNTANHDVAYLRAVFNVVIRMGEWQGENPFAAIQAIRLPEQELSYLDQSQIEALFQSLSESRNKDVSLIASLCLTTGARWGEGQTVRNELIRNNTVTYVDTKNGRSRTVPLPSNLHDQLKQHAQKHGRVFPIDAYQAFTNALNRSGIRLPKGQRTHVLRHTFASHFIMNGGDLLTLQKILGHRTIQMTMRYAHLSPGHLAEAVQYGPKLPMHSLSTNSVPMTSVDGM